jgi:hypothetical protein
MSLPPNEPIRTPKTSKPPGNVISLMRLDQEKRRHYRVHQAAMPTLFAAVPFTDGSRRTGRCQDISVGGTGVRFTIEQDPQLEPGMEVVLVFETPSYQKPLQLVARVLSKHTLDATAVRYTFVFTQPEEVEKHAVGIWCRWFNRRHYRRLAPDASTPLPAQIRWPRGYIDGRVADVSMRGLGIAVPAKRAQEVEGVRQVLLTVVLADNIGELRFAALVRSRTMGIHTARVGLELVRDASYDRNGPILQRWIERTVTRRAAHKLPPR